MAVGVEDEAITGVTNSSAHGRNLPRPIGLPWTRARGVSDMSRLDVRSREYKVMLEPDTFAGDEDTIREVAARFWSDARDVLEPLDIPTGGAFDEVKARRRIRFLDSVDHRLNSRRYVLRERVDIESEEREVTLKFRHPDRYVASDRDMGASGRGNAETKFEEDVKPPFVSVFSYSTTVEVDDDVDVSRLREVIDLFPGLADELDGAGDDELTDVGSFCARELVLVGAVLQLGKRDVEAECAIVVWHDDAGAAAGKPACVEFSFKYGDDQEDYRGSVARDAHDVLQAMQQLSWVHPKPTTKTALVYR